MTPAKEMEARAKAKAFDRALEETFKDGASLAGRNTP
jgi:hypothetical protein